MPNANPFREANRIYKLPFAVPVKPVASQGLRVPLIFQAGSWVLDWPRRLTEQRQRVLFSCPELWQAGRQAGLPAQNTPALPSLEPAGRWRGPNCSGFRSGSAGGDWEALGAPGEALKPSPALLRLCCARSCPQPRQ